MKKILSWLDQNLLLILAAFLFAFIPLFPKIPLFDILPGYIVRIRAEDFFVGLTGLVWFIQILRKKVVWRSTVSVFVVGYALLGLTSMVLGSILTATIPPHLIHIGKSALHFFRYLEYFSLFFFTYSAVKTKRDIKIFVAVLTLTVIGIAVYGAGQKYLNWPLYSTMNREYSKGEALYLSEYARVQSTFAGHYDLTAYLVLVLPILFALMLTLPNWKVRFGLGIAQAAGIWLLLVGSSTSSLVAYALTIAVVLFFKMQSVNKSVTTVLKWLVGAGVGSLILIGAIITLAPSVYTNIAETTQPVAPVYSVFLKIDSKLPNSSPLKITTDNLTEEGNIKPKDVYVDVPDLVRVATTSASAETTFMIVEKERTWSENALKYGLSMGIRLDTLWPQALKGFMKNPITGSGYATLNKGDTEVYTEADSTDNNFLRVLGETGLVGVMLFFGLIVFVTKTALRSTAKKDPFIAALNVGYIAGILGLMINALTIDVFAASKVAFTFWAITGFMYASERVLSKQQAQKLEMARLERAKTFFQKHGLMILASIIFFLSIYANPFTEKSPVLNFASDMAGSEQIAIARCYLRNGTFELCRGNLVAETPITLYPIVLTVFLRIYNNPGMFFVLNLAILLVLSSSFVLLMQKLKLSNQLQLGLFLLFLAHPEVSSKLMIAELTMVPVVYGALLLFFGKLVQRNSSTICHIATKLTLGVALVGFLLTFVNATNLKDIQNTFQEKHSNWRYMAITQINNFFYDAAVGKNATLDPNKTPYVITATNPYFIDMYANGMYQALPLFATQRHMNQPQNVWGEGDYSSLLSLYKNTLTTNPVYLSDVDITTDESKAAFKQIHQNFDLSIKRIGCDYNCFIYEVTEETLPISPEPKTVTLPLETNTLQDEYSFSVVSTRFEPGYTTPFTLQTLSNSYATASENSDFMIVTGDLLPKYDQGQFTALSQLYLQTDDAKPVLFAPGNLDLLQEKKDVPVASYFFTNQEFFLFINPDQYGGMGEGQQAAILNQILTLEKMPNIQTVFVFSHQANWVGYDSYLQEMSGLSVSRSPQPKDRFMIQQVLPRIRALSDKQVFIVSGDISPTANTYRFETKLPNSNMTFLSSAIFNNPIDTTIRFTKRDSLWSYDFIQNH